MKKYHKYVFDLEQRKFVGDFESMYKAEKTDVFDSWQQEDMRVIERLITLDVINQYQYDQVVDLGCGKGTFTHILKKRNNEVYALDIAPTALDIARERYPDIEFIPMDLSNLGMLEAFLEALPPSNGKRLIFTAELLSYMENWKELIALVARYTDFFMSHLYLPPDPIGFVKTHDELSAVIGEHFNIEEEILLKKSSFQITFASK